MPFIVGGGGVGNSTFFFFFNIFNLFSGGEMYVGKIYHLRHLKAIT